MAIILLCENDLETATALVAMLSAEGHDVEEVETGWDLLQSAQHCVPDLVLVAERAPVFDGYETCAQLRQDPTFPHDLPVLIVCEEQPDARRLDAVQASGFLLRRRSADEFRSLLVDLLGPLANPRSV